MWLPHLLQVIGLLFGAVGATAVLAADWSTVEDYLVKIGRTVPLLHSIPLIGYPFRQAKYLADMLESSEELFTNRNTVTNKQGGFILLKKLAIRENERKSIFRHPQLVAQINDEDFVEMKLARTVDGSIEVGDGMYVELFDKQGNSSGWVRTDRLRNSVVNYAKDIMSKTGASLFVGGFLLQLLAELISIPSYPTIRIPHVVVGVSLLFAVLSIPGFCEQMKLR
jgi:hypothetical protein